MANIDIRTLRDVFGGILLRDAPRGSVPDYIRKEDALEIVRIMQAFDEAVATVEAELN